MKSFVRRIAVWNFELYCILISFANYYYLDYLLVEDISCGTPPRFAFMKRLYFFSFYFKRRGGRMNRMEWRGRVDGG